MSNPTHGPLPEVTQAQQMLRDGATIQQVVDATGIRSDVVGYYWRHLSQGEVFDRALLKWVKPA